MELRPIDPEDVPACVEVFYESDGELTARHNLPLSPRNEERMIRVFTDIAATTPHRAWLAEDGGEVIAFGMAIERGDLTFLSFLFVRSSAQAAGIGRRLFERCMPLQGFRGTCVWSVQPVSAGLYASYGLVPRTPIYSFAGRPERELPTLPRGLDIGTADEATMDAFDREILGITRPADLSNWLAWGRRPISLLAKGEAIGYGCIDAVGRIGPVVVRQRDHLLPFLGTLLAELDPPGAWLIQVPGVAAETFTALLQSGMRFDGAPVIYCATEDRIDHSRYLPAGFALP
ncbi:MAG TPA: GNAT family N-acetyltransferase [Aeromicrobium sp.]|nr:GNAT family N-acetyltransferase [Aeromicrobium sp.]